MINSPAALNLQDTVTKNIRILMAAYGTKQEEFAADLGVAQSGLSRKLNRRTDWTMSDIANAACFFNISVADLVLPITFSTGLRPDYQCNIMLHLIMRSPVNLPEQRAHATS